MLMEALPKGHSPRRLDPPTPAAPPPPTTVFDPTANGTNFDVCFGGDPGATYTIECSTNISAGWMKFTNVMGSFTADDCGVGAIQLHDIISASPKRFYRVVYPGY